MRGLNHTELLQRFKAMAGQNSSLPLALRVLVKVHTVPQPNPLYYNQTYQTGPRHIASGCPHHANGIPKRQPG
jgi:hypothetical protein